MPTRVCIVCDKEREDGLDIFEKFICRACEEKIVTTAACDKEYPVLIDKLKKLWEVIAAGAIVKG